MLSSRQKWPDNYPDYRFWKCSKFNRSHFQLGDWNLFWSLSLAVWANFLTMVFLQIVFLLAQKIERFPRNLKFLTLRLHRKFPCLRADVSYFLCCIKEIGDVCTQARSSRAAKEIGDVCTQAHWRKGVLSDTRQPKVRPLPFENVLTWLASQAFVTHSGPAPRTSAESKDKFVIVRKYQLVVT